ncbi:hypothetical protein HWV62_24628 [Athelia sp. TMB]|nr:hypothetical protein HWV62_24628 [Athelia sp. TMB]
MPSRGLEPIQIIPDDALAEIFLAFVAEQLQDDVFSSTSPIMLGSVCRRWRAVTLSVPRLWTYIHHAVYDYSKFANAAHTLRLFTSRSGACPLQVFIIINGKGAAELLTEAEVIMTSDEEAHCQALVTVLADSMTRWKYVYLKSTSDFLLRLERARPAGHSLPMLERLIIDKPTWDGGWRRTTPVKLFAMAPRLRVVVFSTRMDVFVDEEPSIELPYHQIERMERTIARNTNSFLQILRICPNLTRCNQLWLINGVDRALVSVAHPLRSLDITFYQDSGADFFEYAELPHLIDLRIRSLNSWGPRTLINGITFLSRSSSLRRLVIRTEGTHMPGADLRTILKAVPSLVDFEFVHSNTSNDTTPTTYSKELLEGLTLTALEPMLPNLRALSLLGPLIADPVAFSAMLRSRIKNNDDASQPRGAILQSLQLHILDHTGSLTIGDLEEIQDALGDNACIRMIECLPDRSPVFSELL